MFDNISTDVPGPPGGPAMEALGITSQSQLAFANIRYNTDGSERQDFVFNQEPYRRASIMIVGLNYGTGSSRTTAITRPLAAWGVRVYIGESFGPIFVTNAVQYGVLTVQLPRPTVDQIAAWVRANPGVEMAVDLERQVIEMPGQALQVQDKDELFAAVKKLRSEMRQAAQELEFERAAELRDRARELESLALELG